MVYLQADSLYEYIIMVTLRYKTSHVNQKYIDFVVFWGGGGVFSLKTTMFYIVMGNNAEHTKVINRTSIPNTFNDKNNKDLICK